MADRQSTVERKEEGGDEEQTKFLHDAKQNIKTHALQMKLALDNNNMMEALKHASNMVGELRTSMLGPKNYYALYLEALVHLKHLESILLDGKHGKKIGELYELVQYAGNVLPRLYLIITVGSAYIKLKEAPAKDVLQDLVEMCRGVQHPTRGLFLRTYLTECTKDKMPDVGSEYEGRGGTVKDSIQFALVNFTEMNKLWVRMQHQGAARDRPKREQERSELKQLVGKNISLLSNLEGVDLELYQTVVLPKLSEQIVNCKDAIAQQYLMECIILAFPDGFHLKTLDSFLTTASQLVPGVNVKQMLVGLMDRLVSFVQGSKNPNEVIPSEVDVFEIFARQIPEIITRQGNVLTEDILALYSSLMALTIAFYPSRIENVDTVLKIVVETLEKRVEEQTKQSVVKQTLKLLTVPLDSFKNVLTLLKLDHYPKLMATLNATNKKKVAMDMVHAALDNQVSVTDPEQVQKFLDLITPLTADDTQSQNPLDQADNEDFEEEQNAVGSLVQLFNNSSLDTLFSMFITARKAFGQGGAKRVKHTLPPLVFCAFKLASKYKSSGDEQWSPKAQKVFKFVHETITALCRTNYAEVSLKLFLQAAIVANKCGSSFETIAYEFMTQAFIIYEEQVSDISTIQFNSIVTIVGTLQSLDIFTEENYDTLSTKTAVYSAKLLKKPDQCRAIYRCSHLFWRPSVSNYTNQKRVLECLQKALKIADTCADSSLNVQLFVEILNEYLYYFENKCETIGVEYVTGMIALINTHMSNLDANDSESNKIITYYQSSLNYIKWKSQSDPRYAEIGVK